MKMERGLITISAGQEHFPRLWQMELGKEDRPREERERDKGTKNVSPCCQEEAGSR